MFISKKVLMGLVAIVLLSVVSAYMGSRSSIAHAQSGVVPYTNARYVFTGSESNTAIFDTSTGTYRVWSPSDSKFVTTYDFNVHKVVAIDSLSFR